MITVLLLFVALAIGISSIVAHVRLDELERNVDTLADRLQRTDGRLSDEMFHLRHVAAPEAAPNREKATP